MRKVIVIDSNLVVSFGDTQFVTLQHIAGELVLKVIAENLELEKQWKITLKGEEKDIYDRVLEDFAQWLAQNKEHAFEFDTNIDGNVAQKRLSDVRLN